MEQRGIFDLKSNLYPLIIISSSSFPKCFLSLVFIVYLVSTCHLFPSFPKRNSILRKKKVHLSLLYFLCMIIKYILSLLDADPNHMHAALLVLIHSPSTLKAHSYITIYFQQKKLFILRPCCYV